MSEGWAPLQNQSSLYLLPLTLYIPGLYTLPTILL